MKFRSLLLLLVLGQYSLVSFGANDTLSTANSAANSTNNAQSITFNSASPNHTKATIESTANPSMGGFSGSFSSDYCGATMQASAGAVGFGFSAGGPKIDSSCVMLRTFERTQQAAASVSPADPFQASVLRKSSLEILALIDPKVKEIFERNGLIGNDSNVTKAQPKAVEGNMAQMISPATSLIKPDTTTTSVNSLVKPDTNKTSTSASSAVKSDKPKNQNVALESKLESTPKSGNSASLNSPVKNKIEPVQDVSANLINSKVERKETEASSLSDWAQFLKTY